MVKKIEFLRAEEIRAETLVSQMEIKENTSVKMQGVFSRNYSEDLISFANEPDSTNFELSRDGIFHLLPDGLFFKENVIKEIPQEDFHEMYERFREEKKSIEFFFHPFDTEYFHLSLENEENLNHIANKGNRFFLNTFFEEAAFETTNVYISKMKVLLPFVSNLKGNHGLLADLLVHVLSFEKVEFMEIEPLWIRFIFHKKGLVQETFNKMTQDVDEFFTFFQKWFLYVELQYDYRIKYFKDFFTLGQTLLLEYNTHF